MPFKGVHDIVIERLAKCLDETGLVQFAYRSDKEASTVAMLEAACKLSGRQGKDETKEEFKKARDAKPLNAEYVP